MSATPQDPAQPSLLRAVRSLIEDLPGLVSDRIQLLSLELQRAGQALSHIVALVTAAAILASTAWLALWVGIAMAIVQAGLPFGWGIALVVISNLAAAAWAIARARSLMHWLRLPATVRQLTGGAPEPGVRPSPLSHQERSHDETRSSAPAHAVRGP